jgi:hypothetical protein
LRLTLLQFWAPGVTAVLILFDYDTDLARHQQSFYRQSLDCRQRAAARQFLNSRFAKSTNVAVVTRRDYQIEFTSYVPKSPTPFQQLSRNIGCRPQTRLYP